MERKETMRDVFNFMIMFIIVMWSYGLANMMEDHPSEGWGLLWWPIILFAYLWGDKIKKDYE